MIGAHRFIAPERDRAKWVHAHAAGISSSTVAEAATDSGFKRIVDAGFDDAELNEYMLWGIEQEPRMLEFAHREHGILPNDWLICHDRHPERIATPDGLTIGHDAIAEAKTTGDPWDKAWLEGKLTGIPIKYRRQIQWQLHVTGAERCLLLWTLRVPDEHGWFYTPWLEPRFLWIDADQKMQDDLAAVSDRLYEERTKF